MKDNELLIFDAVDWEEDELDALDTLNHFDISTVKIIMKDEKDKKSYMTIMYSNGSVKKINSYTLFKNYDYLGLLTTLSCFYLALIPELLAITMMDHYIIKEKVERFIDEFIMAVEPIIEEDETVDWLNMVYEFQYFKNEPLYSILCRKSKIFKEILESDKPELFV